MSNPLSHSNLFIICTKNRKVQKNNYFVHTTHKGIRFPRHTVHVTHLQTTTFLAIVLHQEKVFTRPFIATVFHCDRYGNRWIYDSKNQTWRHPKIATCRRLVDDDDDLPDTIACALYSFAKQYEHNRAEKDKHQIKPKRCASSVQQTTLLLHVNHLVNLRFVQ